ncbi:hypothetical protein BH10PSE4_BH10PSE4_09320 [soil metagenome]
MVAPGGKTEKGKPMARRGISFGLAATLVIAWPIPPVAHAQDALRDGFTSPPSATRPQVYWQWINGNVSQEGIRLDLDWMKRAGIGGPILFDIGFGSPPIPQYVEHRVGYGTPEWKAMVRYTAERSRALGLAFGLQAGGGWSETGGPWVKPEQAMKKLVWSEATLSGKGPYRLPPPPSVSGPFQDLPIGARFAEPRLYRDAKVVAWRLPDHAAMVSAPSATSSAGGVDVARLSDGAFAASALAAPLAGRGWVMLSFAKATTVRSVTVGVEGVMPTGVVEASDDGVTFRLLATLPGEARQGLPVRTFAFPATAARVVRLRLENGDKPVSVTELAVRSEARVNRFEDKAGWGVLEDYAAFTTPQSGGAIPADGVLDLSDRLGANGTLDWTPPPGRWRVLRLGWSLTGRRDTPASAESLGLEVDKLNADHVRAHLHGLLDPLKAELGDLYGQGGLGFVITDSWEAGQANWTEAMPAEFAARRGYDLTPWLPALTGRVVGDAASTERFLWDYRRTLADLLTEHHFGEIARVLHGEGLSYVAEAPGVDLPTTADGLQAKGRADVPMGEFWVYPQGKPPTPAHMADIREAASAAHVYGKPLVGAEALTTMGEEPWRTGPWQHKRIVDRYMAEGVNHFVLHTSAHQPFLDRKPGMTLRQYGQHLSRNETWAEGEMRAWTDYLARSAWILRQGRPGADIAYFYGEGAAASLPLLEGGRPSLPAGYDFDYLDAESLIQRMSAQDGQLALPSGMRYRALVLPRRIDRMSLPVLRKIETLVAAGALVIGERPAGSPSLSGGAAADVEWRALVDRLWGEGRVRSGDVGQILAQAQITPAVLPPGDPGKGFGDTLVWTRRVLDDGELYFVANTSDRPVAVDLSFRITGKAPEIWRADTGAATSAGYAIENGRTRVPLALAPSDAVFVVFRRHAESDSRAAPVRTATTVSRVEGPWTVRFAPGLDAPGSITFATLGSWTQQPDPDIRYFSGAATYEKSLNAPKAWFRPGARLLLNLGDVREFATVTLNGKTLPVLWKPPFSVDVTDQLKPGANQLSVRVVNFWANRMIGDLQPGARKHTFAPIQPFEAASSLSPSGLIGPVTLQSEEIR